MSLEDDILKLGRAQPLPEDRLRSLLKRTLGIMRASVPDDFDGRSDDEIVEEVLQTRRTELALVSGLATVNTPRFTHDCDGCHWLGQFEKVDLWWCPSPTSRNLDSVMERYGNEPHEYAATHPPAAFADPDDYLRRAEAWYLTALQRAESVGLYVPPSKPPTEGEKP